MKRILLLALILGVVFYLGGGVIQAGPISDSYDDNPYGNSGDTIHNSNK